MNIERYFSSKLRPFGNLSKPVKLINEKHLQWIRSQPCIISGDPTVDAHHVQLKARIQNDYLTVPLRHDLHMELHNPGLGPNFEDRHGIDIRDALIAKLVERIIELESQAK